VGYIPRRIKVTTTGNYNEILKKLRESEMKKGVLIDES
jgi:hypothetical protein